MSQISEAAVSAREAARDPRGKFGPSATSEAAQVELVATPATAGAGQAPARLSIGAPVQATTSDGATVEANIADRSAPTPDGASTWFAQDGHGRMWEVVKRNGRIRVLADDYDLDMRGKAVDTIHTGQVERVRPSGTPAGRGSVHVPGCSKAGSFAPTSIGPVSRDEAVDDVLRGTRGGQPPCSCLTGERYVTGGASARMLQAIAPDDDLETTIEQVTARRPGDLPTAQQRERLRRECPQVPEEQLEEHVRHARQMDRLATMTFENDDWFDEFHADPTFRERLTDVTEGANDEDARTAWADYLHDEARDSMQALVRSDSSRTSTAA